MLSVLPSIIVLGMAALAALHFAIRYPSPPENVAARLTASNALAGATGLQCIHFVEEAATGFNERFPALLGFPSMSFSFFVVFNVMWIAIWIASVPGLRSSRLVAFFAAWFLAIAGTLNGIAHPLMAVAAGGYFPGLVSSPFSRPRLYLALVQTPCGYAAKRAHRERARVRLTGLGHLQPASSLTLD